MLSIVQKSQDKEPASVYPTLPLGRDTLLLGGGTNISSALGQTIPSRVG